MVQDLLAQSGGFIPRQRIFHAQFRKFMADLGKQWSFQDTERACYHLRLQIMYLLRKKRCPGTPPKKHRHLHFLMDLLVSKTRQFGTEAADADSHHAQSSGDSEEQCDSSSDDVEMIEAARNEPECVELSSSDEPLFADAIADNFDVHDLEQALFKTRRRMKAKCEGAGFYRQVQAPMVVADDELASLFSEALGKEDLAPLPGDYRKAAWKPGELKKRPAAKHKKKIRKPAAKVEEKMCAFEHGIDIGAEIRQYLELECSGEVRKRVYSRIYHKIADIGQKTGVHIDVYKSVAREAAAQAVQRWARSYLYVE